MTRRPDASAGDAPKGPARLQRIQRGQGIQEDTSREDLYTDSEIEVSPVPLKLLAAIENEGSKRGAATRAAAVALERRVDSLSRREADARLRDELALNGFQGREYALFQQELARYGYQVMLAWINQRTIFKYCAEKGIRGLRPESDEDLDWSADDVEELALETVGRALPAFRDIALVKGGWTLEGGATLKTFFIGTCLFAFANTYRMWRRERRRWEKGSQVEEVLYNTAQATAADPADVVETQNAVRAALHGVPDLRTRIALALEAYGFTHAEIAKILADGTTMRGVEALLYRYRKRLQRQEAG